MIQLYPTPSRTGRTASARFGHVLFMLGLALPLLSACGEPTEDPPARRDGGKSSVRRPGLDASVRDGGPSLLVEGGSESDAGPVETGKRADRPALCERDRADAVRDLFCGPKAPKITSLLDLERQLGLALPGSDPAPAADAPSETLKGMVFLGHSTALSGHLVTPINPRALLLGNDTALAFQRGVQAVEIATFDSGNGAFNFYLLEFEQACNRSPKGCVPGDLYTPSIERNWERLALRDDEDLKNTHLDCRQCHQRGREKPMLLMRELVGPWSHFFADEPAADGTGYGSADYDAGGTGDGGREHAYAAPSLDEDLVAAYRRAKSDEGYAGLPGSMLGQTAGFFLQSAVPRAQPLEYHSPTIQTERGMSDAGTPPLLRRSPSWDRAYAAFKRGEHLALPHFAEDPTDRAKVARLSTEYRRYLSRDLPAEQLPDLADVFPDDPQMRAEIGLTTEPGATPAEALIQACGACHNDVLDQSISRARFSIDLKRMDLAERELAIERIERSREATGVMPPPNARQLTPEARTKLIAYLRQAVRSPADDALLGRAAELGMAGNVERPPP